MMHGPSARGTVFASCIPVYVQSIVKTGSASVDALWVIYQVCTHSIEKKLAHKAQSIGSLGVLTMRKSKTIGSGDILNTTMCGKFNVSLIESGNVSVIKKEQTI